MKARNDILDHLRYGLAHVDGLCWLCDHLLAGVPAGNVSVTVGGRVLIDRPSFAHLQNPLAEAGLIYCRKLLDFLGLKLRKDGSAFYERTHPYTDDTVGIEDLSLGRVSLSAFGATPFGEHGVVAAACEHTLRAANKGVAHFTEDRGERGDAEKVRLCTQVVSWLVEKHVYAALSIGPPDYQVWTAG